MSACRSPQDVIDPSPILPGLPALRFGVAEAAKMLRMSRAQLYHRIRDGMITPQKDGTRTYFTRDELERYVQRCGNPDSPECEARTRDARKETSSGIGAASASAAGRDRRLRRESRKQGALQR